MSSEDCASKCVPVFHPLMVKHCQSWLRQLLLLIYAPSTAANWERILFYQILEPCYIALLQYVRNAQLKENGTYRSLTCWQSSKNPDDLWSMPIIRVDVLIHSEGQPEESYFQHLQSVTENSSTRMPPILGLCYLHGVDRQPDRMHQLLQLMLLFVQNGIRESALLSDLHAEIPIGSYNMHKDTTVPLQKSTTWKSAVNGANFNNLPNWLGNIMNLSDTDAQSKSFVASIPTWKQSLTEYNAVSQELKKFVESFGGSMKRMSDYTDSFDSKAKSLTPKNRFTRMIHALELTEVSLSPLVNYPTPFILKRLRQLECTNDRNSMSSSGSKTLDSHNVESVQERLVRLTTNSEESRQTTVLSHISDRTALQSLKTDNDKVEGRLKHQGLSFLQTFSRHVGHNEHPGKPCWSHIRQLKFYDSNSDQTLIKFLCNMVKGMDHSCKSVNGQQQCGRPRYEHVWSISVGDRRVNVQVGRLESSIEKAPWTIPAIFQKYLYSFDSSILPIPGHRTSSLNKTSSCLIDAPNEVHTWIVCPLCHSCSPVSQLTDISKGYSFGKYLEQFLGNPLFICNSAQLCRSKNGGTGTHANHREFVRQYFLLDFKFLVMFDSESLRLFDVSLPSTASTFNDIQLTAGDGYGTAIGSLSDVKFLKSFVIDYWKQVYDTLTHWESEAFRHSDTGSPLLVLLGNLMRERLRSEEKLMFEMIQMAADEVTAPLTPAILTSKNAIIDLSVNSSVMALRGVRKLLFDKMIAVDRELSYMRKNVIHDYPKLDFSMRPYTVATHPDSLKLNENLEWAKSPASIIAMALQSNEVRDAMGVLSEFNAYISRLQGDQSVTESDEIRSALFDSTNLPKKFESKSSDGLIRTQATIIDGRNIEYKYLKYKKAETNENRPRYYDSWKTTLSGTLKPHQSIDNLPGYEIFQETTLLIYFAYEFHLLRCLSGHADDFTQSLSNTQEWNPSGGKSGAPFFLTSDEKFVLKAIGSRPIQKSDIFRRMKTNGHRDATDEEMNLELVQNTEERRMLLEFIPKYLDYMINNVYPRSVSDQGKPSALVKTFGVFTATNFSADPTIANFDMTLMVMEQLFYKCKISQKFDLKGIRSRSATEESNGLPLFRLLRSRTVQKSPKYRSSDKTSAQDKTLWDDNWIQTMYTKGVPGKCSSNNSQGAELYIYPHSRHVLRQVLKQDTEFLESANIIDYSLLVGLDLENHQIIVGIVDYTVEYNLWKKLENHSKTVLLLLENAVKSAQSSVEPGHQSIKSKSKPLPPLPTLNDIFSAPPSPPPEEFRSNTVSHSSTETITVQPPNKYRDRFMAAMDDYFLAVPDKWTRSATDL